MQMDLTETLMMDDADSGSAFRRSARLVGLIGGVVGLASAILLLPFGFGATAHTLLLSMGMVVLFNGLGFAMMDRLNASGARIAAAAMLLLPFALVSVGLGIGPALGVAAILLAERMVFGARRALRPQLLAAAIGLTAFAGVVALDKSPGATGVLVVALLPLGWALFKRLTGRRNRPLAKSPADPVLAAHLGARLRVSKGAQLLVDIAGGIDPALPDAPFSLMLAGEIGLDTSLVEACLIADRPPVLHALARAIHDRVMSPPFVLRLRIPAPQASPAPPRYAAWRCVIVPAETVAGRAVVMLDPDLQPMQLGAGLDAQLIQRAMHDAVSPFNAAIGYLDMLSDEVLVPADAAKRLDYARESAGALRLAHRNTQIIGRWLRLAESREDAPRRVAPIMLIEDVISAMMRQNEELSIRVQGAALLPPVLVDADCARFAIEVLLRPLAGQGGTLNVVLDARGWVLEAVPRRSGAQPDSLQHALEAAVRQHCHGQMNLTSQGSQLLALRVGNVIDEPKAMPGPQRLRQAS